MPKDRTPDVEQVIFNTDSAIGIAGIWAKQFSTGEHFDIYWGGNPWVEIVPKDTKFPVVILPLSYPMRLHVRR